MTPLTFSLAGFLLCAGGGATLNYLDTGKMYKTLPGHPFRYWTMIGAGIPIGAFLYLLATASML